jgi:hypothetical protein
MKSDSRHSWLLVSVAGSPVEIESTGETVAAVATEGLEAHTRVSASMQKALGADLHLVLSLLLASRPPPSPSLTLDHPFSEVSLAPPDIPALWPRSCCSS